MRKLAKLSLIAILCTTLICGPIACSVDQVIGLLQDAALIASAAGPILAEISPEYSGLGNQVSKDLNDLAGLYSAFEKAQAADKPGIEGNIHALTSTALSSLQTIFQDARIKDPKTQAVVTAFVTAANTAIVALEAKVGTTQPKTSAAQAKVLKQAAALPVNKQAKSGSDLKKAWNQAVATNHPEAIVK